MPPASRRLLFPGFCLGLGKGPGSLSLPRDTHADRVLPAWDAEREAGGESCLCPLPQDLGTSHEPYWCPLVASSRCPPCLSHHWHFLPIPGSYSWDRSWSILPPLCPLLASCHQHSLQALCMASATSSCPLCGHPQMQIYTHHPWDPPCRGSPAASPSQGLYRSPSKNDVGFTVTSGSQEPITWLFIYIPKATLITPQGGITSGICFLGQNVDGKKSCEQSDIPEETEEIGEPASSLSLPVTRNTLMNSKQR